MLKFSEMKRKSLAYSFCSVGVSATLLVGAVLQSAKAIAAISVVTERDLNQKSAQLNSEFSAQGLPSQRQPLAIQNSPELPPLEDAETFLPTPDLTSDISLVIDLSDRRVYVYNQEQLNTSFPVAIGREGWETPVGTYSVTRMQQNPAWRHPFTNQVVPPGDGNPLGARWIGFWTDGTNAIGLHGTPNADSVGQAASHGCVRMLNQDVIALYEQVAIGTPVSVVP